MVLLVDSYVRIIYSSYFIKYVSKTGYYGKIELDEYNVLGVQVLSNYWSVYRHRGLRIAEMLINIDYDDNKIDVNKFNYVRIRLIIINNILHLSMQAT